MWGKTSREHVLSFDRMTFTGDRLFFLSEKGLVTPGQIARLSISHFPHEPENYEFGPTRGNYMWITQCSIPCRLWGQKRGNVSSKNQQDADADQGSRVLLAFIGLALVGNQNKEHTV
jgi:hypothetical protein